MTWEPQGHTGREIKSSCTFGNAIIVLRSTKFRSKEPHTVIITCPEIAYCTLFTHCFLHEEYRACIRLLHLGRLSEVGSSCGSPLSQSSLYSPDVLNMNPGGDELVLGDHLQRINYITIHMGSNISAPLLSSQNTEEELLELATLADYGSAAFLAPQAAYR